MLIDLTLPITPEMATQKSDPSLAGHLGTHFDGMNKEFPLEYTVCAGIAFDVSSVKERDIEPEDIELAKVEKGMFVAFYTGYIEKIPYGAPGYFSEHPQLSPSLIEALVEKGVAIIAVDCGGIRRGKEHTPMDQYCADRGTFVVENLWELKPLAGCRFIAYTYPMRLLGFSGLPCRVIAEM